MTEKPQGNPVACGAFFVCGFCHHEGHENKGRVWAYEIFMFFVLFVLFVVSPIDVLVGAAAFFTTKDTKGHKGNWVTEIFVVFVRFVVKDIFLR